MNDIIHKMEKDEVICKGETELEDVTRKGKVVIDDNIHWLIWTSVGLIALPACLSVVFYFTKHPVWLGLTFAFGLVGPLLPYLVLRNMKKFVQTVVRKTYGKPITDMELIKTAVPGGVYSVNYVYKVPEMGLLLLLFSHSGKFRGYILIKKGLMDESSMLPQVGKSVNVKYPNDGSHTRILFLEAKEMTIPEMKKAEKGTYPALEDVSGDMDNVSQIPLQ